MFTEHLKKVVDNVDGSTAALIMGLDGIAVEDYAIDSGDIQTIGMEFSFILTQIRKAAEILEIGGLREIAIKAEQLTVAIRMNDPGEALYYFEMVQKKDPAFRDVGKLVPSLQAAVGSQQPGPTSSQQR